MTAPRRRRVGRRAAALLVALTSCLGSAAVAFGLPPFTTAAKESSAGSGFQAELFGATAGCHPAFDRFVIRARFATPFYEVRYVRRIVQDGSGLPVRLRGAKRIRVVVRNGRAHTGGGASLLPRVETPLCPNLRQFKLAGDFEGVVTFGLGMRRKTGFRVFRLTNPRRIVVDVAH